MTNKKIIAIGGGLLRKGETIKIDKYIVKTTNKKTPQIAFIPLITSLLNGSDVWVFRMKSGHTWNAIGSPATTWKLMALCLCPWISV